MQDSYENASVICSESAVEALGGCKNSNPEVLRAQLTRRIQTVEHARDK